MKRITIGRNPGCDIVFDNNMVSRNHALLNIYPSGKLEIVSMGTNGTKVKGNLITNSQPYPLKRGDDVCFAGGNFLDWSLVPNPTRKWKILGFSVGGAILLAAVIWGAVEILNGSKSGEASSNDDEAGVENTTGNEDTENAGSNEGKDVNTEENKEKDVKADKNAKDDTGNEDAKTTTTDQSSKTTVTKKTPGNKNKSVKTKDNKTEAKQTAPTTESDDNDWHP